MLYQEGPACIQVSDEELARLAAAAERDQDDPEQDR